MSAIVVLVHPCGCTVWIWLAIQPLHFSKWCCFQLTLLFGSLAGLDGSVAGLELSQFA